MYFLLILGVHCTEILFGASHKCLPIIVTSLKCSDKSKSLEILVYDFYF